MGEPEKARSGCVRIKYENGVGDRASTEESNGNVLQEETPWLGSLG